MTYEEKLQKIVSRLKHERDLTRKDHKTKVIFDDSSFGFTDVRIRDICKILLKFQDDGIVKILNALQPIETVSTEQIINPSDNDDYEFVEEITVELGEEFDDWYEKYLLRQKSKPENLDWLNLLKVFDVCSDIDQQIQMTRNATVTIPSFPYPYIGRFLELFPYDSVGTRKSYQQHRWEGTQYLLKEGMALEADYDSDNVLGYGNIVIRIDPVKFDDFYKAIKAEFEKRKKSFDKAEEKPKTIDKTTVKLKATYNAQKGELDIEGKKVKFKKDSFRAKLLELLLKDDKSRKKEWSWDEVIEEIEDTKGKEATTENKKKFYPACDGLAKHIASKTGVNDLLTFTKSTVQINSKYL